jgi:hypothetical protein
LQAGQIRRRWTSSEKNGVAAVHADALAGLTGDCPDVLRQLVHLRKRTARRAEYRSPCAVASDEAGWPSLGSFFVLIAAFLAVIESGIKSQLVADPFLATPAFMFSSCHHLVGRNVIVLFDPFLDP